MLQRNPKYVPGPAAMPQGTPCPNCGYLADASVGVPNFCPSCGAARRLSKSPLPAEAPGEGTLEQIRVGDVIADRYRLIDLLGEGGMGAVYQAEHIRMGKALAVKFLRGSFAREPDAVARFRTEAQIVSRLSNPHTIAVFDFGEIASGDGFYLAMEYVPGKDLSAVLAELGRLPEARAVTIGEQLLASLAEAHDAGIIHRDIKPGNVMLMENRSGEDFVKVLDFGIARLRDAPSSTGEISAGVIVGTPNYLSPEQVRSEPLDGRADIYAVGALLYELVSGCCPFVEANVMALLSAQLTRKPKPLRELVPEVSPAFAAVVHRALQKKPADRFESADAMREALLGIGEPTSARAARTISVPDVTSQGLRIANRQDFADLERQLRALKRSRASAPATVVALLLAAGFVAWRWPDVYDFVQDRMPRLAAALPASLRPADLYDGEEHEPNDTPAQANPLPTPPGPDGRRGGGVALMRGHIGARISDATGDVDVYRIEVSRVDRPLVLHAEWSGEKPGEGIRGLDVALTLNRDRSGGSSRRSAALIASVDRGGPGLSRELVAAVAPGTYYLAVREKHPESEPPVEKPSDRYTLRVWLAEPQPGEKIEPKGPDSVGDRPVRQPEWHALAERNPLGEGDAARGTASAEALDTYSVAARSPADVPEVVAIVPGQRLGVATWLWVPNELDPA
ncbi:MAG TPA: serine/threonine-protein kinase, partial [Anaeromyxobacteraceae bacterium]|nr:serine/threonine-protein kinase [Anaeromyxobacteraceae bacterium]